MASKPLHAVVETGTFLRTAKTAHLSEEDRTGIVDALAANPEMGTALGGGLYKARIAREGGGKSGGFRTIHYFRSEAMPVFLLAVYAKNDKSTLSKAEESSLEKIAAQIGETYGG